MKERGMIFNGEMVRAILDGRKTQTRRIMKVQPESNQLGLLLITDSTKHSDIGKYHWAESNATGNHVRSKLFSCPFGAVGDRIWVRETWAILGNEDGCCIDWEEKLCKADERSAARIYRASCEQRPGNYGLWSIPDDADWKPHTKDYQYEGAWRPSIHMPRWASRILLEITDVRVERLNAISEEDATAEGVPPAGSLLPDYPGTFLTPKGDFATAKVAFQRLWESIYGEESWKANGWVWVISFKRVEGGAA
ncbi:morphogenetic protein [Klebsiella variicola]|uniref:hypothetical protein n=1 Tax=Klebsiella variicola TaxID=244366 RepID=UPI0007CBBF1E|nr:hypothetical protein [Klebsiella variicola]SAY05008.1 morphogenetic protein [Klebsiella variicola]